MWDHCSEPPPNADRSAAVRVVREGSVETITKASTAVSTAPRWAVVMRTASSIVQTDTAVPNSAALMLGQEERQTAEARRFSWVCIWKPALQWMTHSLPFLACARLYLRSGCGLHAYRQALGSVISDRVSSFRSREVASPGLE